jgi:hypothetical protein
VALSLASPKKHSGLWPFNDNNRRRALVAEEPSRSRSRTNASREMSSTSQSERIIPHRPGQAQRPAAHCRSRIERSAAQANPHLRPEYLLLRRKGPTLEFHGPTLGHGVSIGTCSRRIAPPCRYKRGNRERAAIKPATALQGVRSPPELQACQLSVLRFVCRPRSPHMPRMKLRRAPRRSINFACAV